MSTDSLLPGSAKTELQHRLDICIAGRWMYEQGYNVACEGNVSVRLDDKRILTTPTCMNKGMLAPEDLVVTDLDGRQLSGQRKFSSELAMHLRRPPRGLRLLDADLIRLCFRKLSLDSAAFR